MKKIKHTAIAALLFLAILGGGTIVPNPACPPIPENGPQVTTTVAVSVSYVPEADQTHG